MRAGSVYMEFGDGTSAWVPAADVQGALNDPDPNTRGKIVPKVRMKVDGPGGPIVREFPGNRVPFMWQDKGVVMREGDTTQGTPAARAFGNITAGSVGNTVRGAGLMAPALIPGLTVPRALLRLVTGVFTGTAGDMAGRAIEGQPFDPSGSLQYGAVTSAASAPFEAAATFLPRSAPGMMAESIRPTRSQQKAAERVAARQGGTPATPDYELLGRQALDEGVRPQHGRGGPNPKKGAAAQVQAKNESDMTAVQDIIDQAVAAGHQTFPSELARSQEVRDAIEQLRMQGAPKEDLAYARKWLSEFMRTRSVPGIPSRPTGLVNAQGEPIMTKKVPATQKPFDADRLNTEKKVWRDVSKPVLDARQRGEVAGNRQSVEAILHDALARAAKRKINNLPFTTADPLDPNAQIGVGDLHARVERRYPLEEALADYERRPKGTAMDQLYRMAHGRLLTPGTEGYLAQKFNDPRFANVANVMRLLGINVQSSFGGGGQW